MTTDTGAWLATVKRLTDLINARPNPDDGYLLTCGQRVVYGLIPGAETPGFAERPLGDPLEGVPVLPLKLAVRMQQFTGGTITSVGHYLRHVRDEVTRML